jgi:hypothetical protein
MKKTTNKILHRRTLAIASETLAVLTFPQLNKVVGGSGNCQGDSYVRGVCPPAPHTGEEEA